jgi:predicted transcriptional regulator
MKFFNVLKANARISELEAELAAAKIQVSELAANEPESLKALQASLEEVTAKLAATEKLSENLSAVTKERDELKSAAEALKASVDAEAARKAAEIVASQGAVPVKTEGTKQPSELTEQLNAITDPAKRAAFIKANYSALFQTIKK